MKVQGPVRAVMCALVGAGERSRRLYRQTAFAFFWVKNAIPHDNLRKSQHLFQRAKSEKNSCLCFWTRGMVPAEWMEVPAA